MGEYTQPLEKLSPSGCQVYGWDKNTGKGLRTEFIYDWRLQGLVNFFRKRSTRGVRLRSQAGA